MLQAHIEGVENFLLAGICPFYALGDVQETTEGMVQNGARPASWLLLPDEDCLVLGARGSEPVLADVFDNETSDGKLEKDAGFP
jgi:hypothetical protein